MSRSRRTTFGVIVAAVLGFGVAIAVPAMVGAQSVPSVPTLPSSTSPQPPSDLAKLIAALIAQIQSLATNHPFDPSPSPSYPSTPNQGGAPGQGGSGGQLTPGGGSGSSTGGSTGQSSGTGQGSGTGEGDNSTVEEWVKQFKKGNVRIDSNGIPTYTPTMGAPYHSQSVRRPGHSLQAATTAQPGFVIRGSVLVRGSGRTRTVRLRAYRRTGIPAISGFTAKLRPLTGGTPIIKAAIASTRVSKLPVRLELLIYSGSGTVRRTQTFQAPIRR